MHRILVFVLAVAWALAPGHGVAQNMTGALIGTVKDTQGGVLPAARKRKDHVMRFV